MKGEKCRYTMTNITHASYRYTFVYSVHNNQDMGDPISTIAKNCDKIHSVSMFLFVVECESISLIFTLSSAIHSFTRQIKLNEYDDVCATSCCHLEENRFYIENYSIPKLIKILTPARNCRSMVKNPLPLIEMSKLLICDRSSCFAKCSFSLSPAQKVSFSMFLISSVFYENVEFSQTDQNKLLFTFR